MYGLYMYDLAVQLRMYVCMDCMTWPRVYVLAVVSLIHLVFLCEGFLLCVCCEDK